MRPFFEFLRKRRLRGSSLPSECLKVLSFLQPSQVFERGLPDIAIQGAFTDSECTVERFRVNPAFINFMHEVIKTVGPTDVAMQEAAAQQGNGWLFVIDLRTPEGPLGEVPTEDVIGGFEVTDGKLQPDSYRRNEKHRVLTKNGPVKLPPFLQEALVRAALERACPIPK